MERWARPLAHIVAGAVTLAAGLAVVILLVSRFTLGAWRFDPVWVGSAIVLLCLGAALGGGTPASGWGEAQVQAAHSRTPHRDYSLALLLAALLLAGGWLWLGVD